MGSYRSITPNINVNTESPQLRTELLNTFNRLDGQLSDVPSTYYYQNGPNSTSGAGESVLFQKTLETNVLNQLGDSLHITLVGQTAANANSKAIKVYLDSDVIFDTGAQTLNGSSWVLTGELVRNGGSSQIIYWQMVTSDSTYRGTATVTTASKAFTTNHIFTFMGSGSSNGDVSGYYLKMQLRPKS